MRITLHRFSALNVKCCCSSWLNVGVRRVADVESKCERLIPDEEVNKSLNIRGYK